MSPSRKEKREKAPRKRKAGGGQAEGGPAMGIGADEDKSFQDRVMGMIEWLAAKDPVKAARLIGEYLDDLADELGPAAPKPAKG